MRRILLIGALALASVFSGTASAATTTWSTSYPNTPATPGNICSMQANLSATPGGDPGVPVGKERFNGWGQLYCVSTPNSVKMRTQARWFNPNSVWKSEADSGLVTVCSPGFCFGNSWTMNAIYDATIDTGLCPPCQLWDGLVTEVDVTFGATTYTATNLASPTVGTTWKP